MANIVTYIKLPGITKEQKLSDPIFWHNGKPCNFTWGEATHGGERIPDQAIKTGKIVKVARLLQEIRDYVNEPIIITSWYRPEPYNSWAGGVSNSQHLWGGAVDFYAVGYTYKQMYDIADKIVGDRGGVGKYRNNTITHIDCRGYRERWYN